MIENISKNISSMHFHRQIQLEFLLRVAQARAAQRGGRRSKYEWLLNLPENVLSGERSLAGWLLNCPDDAVGNWFPVYDCSGSMSGRSHQHLALKFFICKMFY